MFEYTKEHLINEIINAKVRAATAIGEEPSREVIDKAREVLENKTEREVKNLFAIMFC